MSCYIAEGTGCLYLRLTCFGRFRILWKETCPTSFHKISEGYLVVVVSVTRRLKILYKKY